MEKKINFWGVLCIVVLFLAFIGCVNPAHHEDASSKKPNNTSTDSKDPSDVSKLPLKNLSVNELNTWEDIEVNLASVGYAKQPFLKGDSLYFVALENKIPKSLYKKELSRSDGEKVFSSDSEISSFIFVDDLLIVSTEDGKIDIGGQKTDLGCVRKTLYSSFSGTDYVLFHHKGTRRVGDTTVCARENEAQEIIENQSQFSLYELDKEKKELKLPAVSQSISADNTSNYRIFDFHKDKIIALKNNFDNQNPVLALGRIESNETRKDVIWSSFTKKGNEAYRAAHFIDSENVVLLAIEEGIATLYWFEVKGYSLYAKGHYKIGETDLENFSHYSFFHTDRQRTHTVLQIRPSNEKTSFYMINKGEELSAIHFFRDWWADVLVANDRVYAIRDGEGSVSSLKFP